MQILLILIIFRNDTPAFYFQKGRQEEAEQAIKFIYTEEGAS